MKQIVLIAAALAFAVPARAEDDLTVKTCLEILAGLNSMNFSGQSSPTAPAPPDAKPYRLAGSARMTMAFDISELSRVQAASQKAQGEFDKTLDQKEPDRQKQLDANWQSILAAPCNVVPGRVKESDLHLGDGPNDNAIPPSVLAVIVPIIDRDK